VAVRFFQNNRAPPNAAIIAASFFLPVGIVIVLHLVGFIRVEGLERFVAATLSVAVLCVAVQRVAGFAELIEMCPSTSS